jgi:hypothetical protein
VETHLRYVYRKLNLAGRGELRGVLGEPAINGGTVASRP